LGQKFLLFLQDPKCIPYWLASSQDRRQQTRLNPVLGIREPPPFQAISFPLIQDTDRPFFFSNSTASGIIPRCPLFTFPGLSCIFFLSTCVFFFFRTMGSARRHGRLMVISFPNASSPSPDPPAVLPAFDRLFWIRKNPAMLGMLAKAFFRRTQGAFGAFEAFVAFPHSHRQRKTSPLSSRTKPDCARVLLCLHSPLSAEMF